MIRACRLEVLQRSNPRRSGNAKFREITIKEFPTLAEARVWLQIAPAGGVNSDYLKYTPADLRS